MLDTMEAERAPFLPEMTSFCVVLEMTAEIFHKALQLGTPHVIPDDKVAFMWDFAEHHYGQDK